MIFAGILDGDQTKQSEIDLVFCKISRPVIKICFWLVISYKYILSRAAKPFIWPAKRVWAALD